MDSQYICYQENLFGLFDFQMNSAYIMFKEPMNSAGNRIIRLVSELCFQVFWGNPFEKHPTDLHQKRVYTSLGSSCTQCVHQS